MADEEVTKKGAKKTSTTKSSEKKVATGSTKRIVQSRSSSVAGKKNTVKKENTSKTATKTEKSTPKTTRKKASTESDEKSKKTTATKKDAVVKSEGTTKKTASKKETSTKKVDKKVDIEPKEKKTRTTTSKKGKHSLSSEEVSNVEKVLEEAIETAKQEILKKAREENKIEIPTIEELLKRAGITETESLVNKKDAPKREEFLSLEEEELEIEEDNDLDEIEEFEDEEELEAEEDFETTDFEEDFEEEEEYEEDEEEFEEDEDFDEENEDDDDEYDDGEDEDEYDEIEEEEEEQPKTRLQRRREREITEAVGKEIKRNKKVADVELGKIHTRVFQNICLAVAMMLYLNFVVLGFVNIENPVFVTDLKVFSIALLVIAVGVFEYAYKKDSGRHALHGIEILMLAFSTMAFIYVNLMWTGKFVYIVALITFLFAIYYVAKSIIVYKKMKKQYFINEMKKVIKRR